MNVFIIFLYICGIISITYTYYNAVSEMLREHDSKPILIKNEGLSKTP